MAVVGGVNLAAWVSGLMTQRGLSSITIKTNSALCLLLLGTSLSLVATDGSDATRRWLARVLAAVAVLVGALTLSENVTGWDFGIDQLLAVEAPGALGVLSPNRMGMPGSIGMLLAGGSVLILSDRYRRSAHAAQALALGVFVIGLVSSIGHLYGARMLYGVAPFTAMAWPTALSLTALGGGLCCARPAEGLMARVTRSDPGGANIRQLLLPTLLLPVIAGWLRLNGERLGWFDPALGTALMMVLFILSFSALAYVGSRRVSRAATALLEADAEREGLLLQVGAERQRLGTVLERLPAGVLIAEAPSGRIVFANAYATGLLGDVVGIEPSAWSGSLKPHYENGVPQQAHEIPIVRALRGELVAGEDLRVARPDGRWASLRLGAVPLCDASGAIGGAVVTFEDVTERRRVEQALQRSESELQTIVENIEQGIVVADMAGRLVHWNRAALDMYGLATPEEGRRLEDLAERVELSDMAGAAVPHESRPLVRILRGERLHDWELQIRRQGSDWQRVYSYGGTLVRDEQGHGLMAVLTISDVTVRKRAEHDVQAARIAAERAQAAAEDASRAKDHFIAVLSHELRTPLAPVLTGIALLEQEGTTSDRGRELVSLIRRNIELESRLIDDLLDVTRIARGKLELDRRRVALCTVVERTVEVCRPEIEARRLDFGVDLGPGPYLVDGDAARLQQVFWNLFKNAVKFTPPGGRVGVRCRPADGHVVVDVEDSGVGIEPSALGGIFDAFVQADRSFARQFGGLGLGLTISKALVELHGGTIEARSEGSGRGATFRVRLPMISHGEAAARQEAAQAERWQHPRREGCLRVLLIEDHRDTADTMVAMLQLAGYEVRSEGDVATALGALAQGRFDVLVSDLGLPDRSGLELLRELRARGEALPAIALSGYGLESDIEQSLAAGFDSHLVKPVEPRRLFEAIENATRKPTLKPRV